MDEKRSTLRQTDGDEGGPEEASAPQPGLVVIFSGAAPCWLPLPLSPAAKDASASLEFALGRDNVGRAVGDGRISRNHALVRYGSGTFSATDLGSLNGSAVDGQPIGPHVARPLHRCLRIGDTLLLAVPDLSAFASGEPRVQSGIVIGPRLSSAYDRIRRLARSSLVLHITGESGAGKENAARSFHAASSVRSGPFIAVNCATIPEGIAERLLFGAKRGAFSGAVADSDGYIQAAHNGTLFLDEVAELHATVQSKLLRVLETREVLPVGAVRPQAVSLRIVSASHRALQAEVTAGRLREDLYYRIGRPSERLPPLRQRLEEIPWLVESELQRASPGLSAHISLIEACVARHWPGNVRELLVEIRDAAQEAAASGSTRVKAEHLAAGAGQVLKPATETEGPPAAGAAPSEPDPPPASEAAEARSCPAAERPSRTLIIAALLDSGCNVSEAARRLGMHRTNLRRQIEQYDINLEQLRQIGRAARE